MSAESTKIFMACVLKYYRESQNASLDAHDVLLVQHLSELGQGLRDQALILGLESDLDSVVRQFIHRIGADGHLRVRRTQTT